MKISPGGRTAKPLRPAHLKRVAGFCLAAAAFDAAFARHAFAIIYRDDESNATALALAQQPQFNGAGQVGVANVGFGPNGSGVAIAPDWVLTAKHLFDNAGSTVGAFYLNNVQYTGTYYLDPYSDLALIHLTAIAGSSTTFTGLPASVNTVIPILPSSNVPTLNQVVWTVGFGGAANYSDQNGTLSFNSGVRAGTNVITNINSGGGFWGADNANNAPDATPFESSTAPGDSGGPLYLQHGNAWYVSGTTFGPGQWQRTTTAPVGGGNTGTPDNFIADTIKSVTGNTYSPTPPAPSYALTWKPVSGVAGNSGGSATWDLANTNFTDGTLQYQWDNSLAQDVTFGGASVPAGAVTVVPTYLKAGAITAPGVTVHNLTFTQPTGNGIFNLTAGTLPAGSAGGNAQGAITFTASANSAGNPTITTNWNGQISAPIVTASGVTVVKNGPGTLGLSGNSTGFAGILQIRNGTVDAQNAAALGAGGFSDNDATYVLAGATLRLSGGYSSDEHIHLNGAGAGSHGALYNGAGDNTLTDPLSLDSAATINIAAATSLTISGGTAGNPGAQIYGGNALTLAGAGTLYLNGPAHVSGITLTGGATLNQQNTGLIDPTATLALTAGEYALGRYSQTLATLTLANAALGLLLNNSLLHGAAGGNGLVTTSALTLGTSGTLDLSTGPSFGPGTYDLVDFTGTLTDNSAGFSGWSVKGLPPGDTARFALTANALQLRVTDSVPEPATLMILSGPATALYFRRRSRHR